MRSSTKETYLEPSAVPTPQSTSCIATPIRMVEETMRSDGISPSKHTKSKKIPSVIWVSVVWSQRHLTHKNDILQGKHLKRWGTGRYISGRTTIERRNFGPLESSNNIRKLRIQRHRTSVKEFFAHQDNSVTMPGKNYAAKVAVKRKQIKVLSDTLWNLHIKVMAETATKCSFSFFARYRPANIKLVKYTQRRVCLCVKHQNASLIMAVKPVCNPGSGTSPDKFIQANTEQKVSEKLQRLEGDAVTYETWNWSWVQGQNHPKNKISERNDCAWHIHRAVRDQCRTVPCTSWTWHSPVTP